MNADLPGHEITEGYMPFAGHRTWYQITGTAEEPGSAEKARVRRGETPEGLEHA